MNKPNMHINIINISTFRVDRLNQHFSSNDFNFKGKIVEGCYKV